MSEPLPYDEPPDWHKTIRRIHEQGSGVACGLILGLGLFIATIVLVVRGGDPVGPHLGQLRVYLPGYSVTLAGSIPGFIYGFVIGYGAGRVIASTYNRLTAGSR